MPSKPTSTRERDIRHWWERDPNGPILRRDRAPTGLRTPNGFVWGHQLAHIFWIQRIPGANALTVWSRSMIKEHGEGYDDRQWDEPLVQPRLVRPWPVLQLLGEHGQAATTLNEPDKGCKREHVKTSRPPDGWVRDPEAIISAEMIGILGECPDDPEEICSGPLLSNAAERAQNVDGEFYDYVWCEHFKEKIVNVDSDFFLRLFTVVNEAAERVHFVADTNGLCIYVPPAEDTSVEVAVAAFGSSATTEDASDTSVVDAVTSEPVCATEPTTEGEDVNMVDADGVPEQKNASDNGTEDTQKDATSSVATEKKSGGTVPPRDPYSVKDLPKLEEFIPDEYLPDVLMVHDRDNTTCSKSGDSKSDKPIMYKRYYPSASSTEETEHWKTSPEGNVAHLYLSKTNRFGSGNHSYVYRAPLTLPHPLSARSPTGQVTVAAKLAYNRCTAHRLLHNEARVYDALPKHTQEEWCGYNVVPQCRFPVPVSAIAPKFFGYYVPVDQNGKGIRREHPNCSEDDPCSVQWASPILLMEECGVPVEPSKFTADQRTECFSLILRLHHMDIVQGSFYVRNIMIQPGPLTLPPEKRSFDHPSFRIIDFGRGHFWAWELDQPDVEKRRFEFARRMGDEVARARNELHVQDLGF